MDASTISAVMNMQAMQSLNSQAGTDSINGGDSSFSNMLNSMMGTAGGMNAMNALNADGTVNYEALLSGMTGGMSLESVQSQMLVQALSAMTNNDKPLLTDPELALLVQKLEGFTGEDASAAEMAGLMQELQDGLRKIMDEQGTQVAGQQALALMAQLFPAFAAAGDGSALGALTQTSGAQALDTLLMADPQKLAQSVSMQTQTVASATGAQAQGNGQTQSNAQAQSSAQQAGTQAGQQAQVSAEVLPQGANAASTAQVDFANVAKNAQQTGTAAASTASASNTAGSTVAQQLPQDASVQVQNGAAGESGNGQLSQMLQTGQAQGNFAEAVRAVKEQMPEESAKAPGVDVDELQKQVDSTSLTGRVQTSDIVRAAEELRGAQQSVPTQLQRAVAQGLENGQERLVVKLNPEELGEVTLEMRKVANGGIILDIIAKNPETQRMLAADLAQLQQNLRSMRVEVQSVVSEQQYQMAAGDGQFGGQHQRTWQEMHGASYYGDEPLTAGEAGEEESLTAAPQSALDAYI